MILLPSVGNNQLSFRIFRPKKGSKHVFQKLKILKTFNNYYVIYWKIQQIICNISYKNSYNINLLDSLIFLNFFISYKVNMKPCSKPKHAWYRKL